MKKVLLGVGSNIGNKQKNIETALSEIADQFKVNHTSYTYQSASLLKDNQPNYHNLILEIDCEISALELLKSIKNIERKMGRVDNGHWMARIIDIDIIDYNNEIIDDDFLHIPHIEMTKRSFVLYPLMDIRADYKNPRDDKNITQMIAGLEELYDIKKLYN